MCTVKEIQEAIREDCRSQHDMDSTDIDRVMQTLPFAQEEPFTEARPQKLHAPADAGNHHQAAGGMAEKASERPGMMKGAAYEGYFSP